jgi:hypothetical protein
MMELYDLCLIYLRSCPNTRALERGFGSRTTRLKQEAVKTRGLIQVRINITSSRKRKRPSQQVPARDTDFVTSKPVWVRPTLSSCNGFIGL